MLRKGERPGRKWRQRAKWRQRSTWQITTQRDSKDETTLRLAIDQYLVSLVAAFGAGGLSPIVKRATRMTVSRVEEDIRLANSFS
jgi:hypothetical protein